ncbi:MAG: BrxE family protein [Terracidiphilus sp.]
MTRVSLNFDKVLKARLIVARFGEMDLAKWWNTRGQLFAQARSVCAVAAHRCREIFDPPDSVTLWRLPENIEEEFEAKWENWLDQANEWRPFFHRLEHLQGNDLKSVLHDFEVVTEQEMKMFSQLRRSAEGRAVPLPEAFSGTDQDVALLALGFARGEIGALAVPYAKKGFAC